MNEELRKKYPSFPPDYVTIGMLRERWLKKQEEEKLKQKQAPEETQNIENGEISLIEENGKGKEEMGWSGNGRITTKKYYNSKNKKHGVDWKKGNGDIPKVNMEDTEKGQNPRSKEGLDLVEKKIGPEGVEISLKKMEKVGIMGFPIGECSGTQGIGKIMSGGMTGTLLKNGVREGSSQISMAHDVRRDGFKGGFRRNKNTGDEGFRGKEHRAELKELKDNNYLVKKMEDDGLQIDRKWNGRKRRNRRGKGDKFKKRGAEMSGFKLNGVELKPADEISEIGNERDRMKGLHSGTGSSCIKQNRVDGEALAADTMVLEKKVEATVLVEKSRDDGFSGYGDRRGNLREKFENLTIDDRKESYLGSKVDRKFGGNSRRVNSGRLEAYRRMKQSNSCMVWVKKEQSVAVGGEASSMGVPPDESSNVSSDT